MNEYAVAAVSCIVLGAMSSTHPCPLTTNMAAVSIMLGWSRDARRGGILSCFFAAGYVIAYAAIGVALAATSLAIPTLAVYLPGVISLFLGPTLIIVGMVHCDLLHVGRSRTGSRARAGDGEWTPGRAVLLGMLLAVAFCPATAAMFFGVMLPLAVRHHAMLVFPLLYALGAGIPPLTVATVLRRGTGVIDRRQRLVRHIQTAAGTALILIGVWLSIRNLYY